jgi:hypothetical protein
MKKEIRDLLYLAILQSGHGVHCKVFEKRTNRLLLPKYLDESKCDCWLKEAKQLIGWDTGVTKKCPLGEDGERTPESYEEDYKWDEFA